MSRLLTPTLAPRLATARRRTARRAGGCRRARAAQQLLRRGGAVRSERGEGDGLADRPSVAGACAGRPASGEREPGREPRARGARGADAGTAEGRARRTRRRRGGPTLPLSFRSWRSAHLEPRRYNHKSLGGRGNDGGRSCRVMCRALADNRCPPGLVSGGCGVSCRAAVRAGASQRRRRARRDDWRGRGADRSAHGRAVVWHHLPGRRGECAVAVLRCQPNDKLDGGGTWRRSPCGGAQPRPIVEHERRRLSCRQRRARRCGGARARVHVRRCGQASGRLAPHARAPTETECSSLELAHANAAFRSPRSYELRTRCVRDTTAPFVARRRPHPRHSADISSPVVDW